MPKQKQHRDGNAPVSFRPGALQRDRLNQLITHRGQQQSTIMNAAIDLLWLLDIGYDRISDIQRQADILTDEGANEPLDPPGLVAKFETVSGHRVSVGQAEAALTERREPVELTERQREVARLLDEGVNQVDIGKQLGIGYSTVKREVAVLRNNGK